MTLPSTAQAWLTGLAAPPTGDEAGARWVTRDELLDGDRLSALHARVRSSRSLPSAAAAVHLVAWWAGPLSRLLGVTAAVTDAALVIDGTDLRWLAGDEPWPRCLRPTRSRLVVSPGHAWRAQREVAVADEPLRYSAALQSLTTAVGPLVTALARLGGIGELALWNEVGDALVVGLPYDVPGGVLDEAMVRRAQRLARHGDAPWRAYADLRRAEIGGAVGWTVRKGGCCLAFQAPDGRRCDACPRRR